MLQPSERYWASRARLLRLLSELETAGWCQRTFYFTPASLASRRAQRAVPSQDPWEARIAPLLQEVGEAETGLALFWGDDQALAVEPPFPLTPDSSGQAEGAEIAPLVELLGRELLIGVILLRLGRYAVGVLQGQNLIASKTDSRYVKNRHRAGGQSQRRFERSRERLIRELYDKACEVTRDVLSPYERQLDYILLGGERHTLRGFVERCGYLQAHASKTLKRNLQVDSPNQEALENIAFEVWKGQVLVCAK
jgi:peptide subunit release factor 1 (eRF1)